MIQVFLLLFCATLQYFIACGQEIAIDCTYNCQALKEALPNKIFVKSIDIQADFKVDQDELLYLIDLVPLSHISFIDLERTIFYLRKKEYFSKIELIYNPIDHRLIFKLDGLFVLSNFRLHGSMIGKEKYKSSYIMETGECFEQKKHVYSLKKMKEKFYQAGYFNAEIKDEIFYDPILKTVKVDLFLQKSKQFTVGDCKFDIASIDKVAQQDLLLISQQLNKLFLKRFLKLKYTKDLVEKAITQLKYFLTKKGFSQSQVTYKELIDYNHHQVNLNFCISFDEKKEFVFWGNHFFTQENFLENISMYGKSSWHFPGAILADEIESMYKAKGFWDVNVSVKEEEHKTFCMIHEGNRAVIQAVEVKDNFHIPSKKLETECFSVLYDKPFDRETFTQAITALQQLYMRHGFWDIKVVKEDFVSFYPLSGKLNTMNYKAVLTLDEGEMRKLKSIEIEGYPELLLEQPFVQYKKLKEAIPFNHSWISAQKNWLINHFKDLGHNKIMVDYLAVDDEDKDGIKLIWSIHLDEKQIYFGKYVVSGNSQIPFKYLKRELLFKQGEVWDKKKIEQSMTNLRNLELFDMVHIYAHKETDDFGQVPVGVKLIAADKYEVRTRIGGQQVGKDFSLQQGFSYKAGGTFIMNNPFKFGDRVVVDADFTRFYENFSIQYLMPWLFASRPIRSQIKIYDNHYLQPLYIGSDVSIYNAAQQGILFGLQEKHQNINVGMSVGLEFKGVSVANIDDIAISIDYNPLLFGKKIAFLFAEPSLMWTNVDSIINPRSGSSALITLLAMADIVDHTSLFKFLGEYALYIPFNPRTVFAIRTRIGHVFNRQYNEILPIDRFYLGGANTIRGYDRDYCPPLGRLTQPVYAPNSGLPPRADNLWNYVNQGGRTMLNCNFETRFPIYYELEGAVYFDAGVLIKDSVQDVPENMLGGVGFGFRYNTPIGPLRFDLAFKLDRKFPEFESPYVWYLTLGQAF